MDGSRRFTQKIEVGRLSYTLCTNPLPPSAFPLHPALPLQLTQVLFFRTGFHFRSEQIRYINIVIILPPILYYLNPKNVFIWYYSNNKKNYSLYDVHLHANLLFKERSHQHLYLLKRVLNKKFLRSRKTWSNLLLIGDQLTNQHTLILRAVCN